jgi:phosphoribosylanthranilate isomerase
MTPQPTPTPRTRIKICGLTRAEDVQTAWQAGADALGFVFYGPSPRYVTPDVAGQLLATVPPFVTTVGLFVNASAGEVAATLAQAPVSCLQFHGDETVEQCVTAAELVNRPFLRAIRVRPDMQPEDLLEYDRRFRTASKLFSGLLLDAFVDGYGGGGKVFDWALIPKDLAPRVVLSGGLSELNVIEALARVRPYAVDVSSGVEHSKGIKDAAKISAFINAVRAVNSSQS